MESKPTSKELKELLNKSKKMYTEVGGISSDGTAVPVPEKKKVQYKRIQIIEADSSDDEEEEEDSTLPFISGMYKKTKNVEISVF